MQLEPFLNVYGRENILPVFFWRLARMPQRELERIYSFIGGRGRPRWDLTLGPLNVGSERLRKSALREFLVSSPLLVPLRRRLIPESLAKLTKAFWRAKVSRPELTEPLRKRLACFFDDDLARLGSCLGVELNCQNFYEVAESCSGDWADAPVESREAGADAGNGGSVNAYDPRAASFEGDSGSCGSYSGRLTTFGSGVGRHRDGVHRLGSGDLEVVVLPDEEEEQGAEEHRSGGNSEQGDVNVALGSLDENAGTTPTPSSGTSPLTG